MSTKKTREEYLKRIKGRKIYRIKYKLKEGKVLKGLPEEVGGWEQYYQSTRSGIFLSKLDIETLTDVILKNYELEADELDIKELDYDVDTLYTLSR